MHGFGLFNAIGRETGKDSLGGNSDVSKVLLKTHIANNIITLEKTKIHVSGFRLRIEGQTSFSKELNLKFRLGLPPLGVIGIPMTVTGTEDKPKVQVRKGKDADELKGTEDTED
jgi:AsmA protein